MSQSALGLGGDRRYSVPSKDLPGMHSEDLHAWSIYRQNLNSDFTDSALGSTDKSPLPYGNFQLRDTTVQSILSHPRYGPKSALGSNMYTYLKFGLPRVFPPNHNGSQRSGTPKPKTSIGSGMKPVPRIQRHGRGVRETSSGYDSSDNETSTNYKYSRKYRSDPDFRMNNLHPSYQPPNAVPVVAMQQAGIRGEPHWVNTRNKSVSEANLLGTDPRPYRPQYGTNRRNSVAEFVPENDHQSYLMPSSHLGGRMSKAGSHMSLAQSRKHSTLRPGDQFDGYTHSAYIYPNYYVNNLEITTPDDKSTLLVSGLNFEVKSGEILAVLATSEHEAAGLLDVLAGVRKKLSGDIVVNGQPVASSTLRKIAGYVRNDTSLCPAMTVEHTLQFHASLRKPRNSVSHLKLDNRDRINLLIEELGLEQVRDTNVGRLTRSEIRRLNVACQLLLDMAILILDQPTKEMDIFDTFFLVEYLRNWAGTGRVVIMSIHPPTYEIFAMLTKVVLISAGRTMYSGYRRDMLPYFASIDYPCPAFKNPSDYYLDLVTLDSLSAAALLESSSRVSALASALPRAPLPAPPPAPLPAPATSRAPIAPLLQKSLIYTQMHTLSNLIIKIIIAAVMSIVTGTIFWDLPTTDSKLTQNDRVGFHYAVMCLTLWPALLWLTVREAGSMRRYVERDIAVGLYSRLVFILVDQFLELWSSVIVWLAYLVPSYAMSGLYAQSLHDYNGFYLYLGFMVLYLISIQMLVRASIFVIPLEKTASVISGLILLVTTLGNGVTLQWEDLPSYLVWVRYVSPSVWTIPELLRRELGEEALKASIAPDMTCTKQNTYQDIIVQKTPCPPPDGAASLHMFGFDSTDHIWGIPEGFLVALAVFYAIFAVIAIVGFIADCTGYARHKQRKMYKGHNVSVNTP